MNDPDRNNWPDPPAPEAFHGIAGEFVRLVEPHTEADRAALLVQFLAAVGSAFGASPHVLIEDDRHGAKLWPVIVGDTSGGRKGTSLGRVENLVRMADPTWAARRAANAGSGEVLVWAVRDAQTTVNKGGNTQTDPGESDKRLFVAQSEFAGLLTVAGRDNSTLSPILRDAWDRSDLRTMSKTQPATASGAHIVVVGHITSEELRRRLTQTEMANGFANRFLWVCSRRSKELPRGGGRPNLEPLAKKLATLIDFARSTGEATYSGGFWAEYEPHYRHLTSGQPGMVGAVLGRAAPYVHHMALEYALLDGVRVIEGKHAVAALALWDYCERSARYIFGDSLGDPIADEILRALRDTPEGLTRTELTNAFGRHRSIGPSLDLLERHRLCRRKAERTAGRTGERWFAVLPGKEAEEAEEGSQQGAYSASSPPPAMQNGAPFDGDEPDEDEDVIPAGVNPADEHWGAK